MNNAKYLNLDGLNTLVGIIKTEFAKQTDLSNVSNIANSTAAIVANQSSEITNINNNVSNISNDLINTNGNVSNISNNVTNIEGNLSNLTNDVTNLGSNVSNIANSVSNISNNVTNINNNVSNLSGDLANNYYTKTEVNTMISGIDKLTYAKVNNISEVVNASTIYLVPKANNAAGNIYDEYMLIDNTVELIGTTEVNLSNYVQFSDFNFANNADIDGLFANNAE